jgi:hypothetical protein
MESNTGLGTYRVREEKLLEVEKGQASCWRMAGDCAIFMRFEREQIRKSLCSIGDSGGAAHRASIPQRNFNRLMRSNMRLHRGCNRFSRSQHRLTADSQYFSREEMISVPRLCAYIPVIYANFPGIFNRVIRLDFLTRRVIDRIRTYSLRHEPHMRQPHVPPVIRTCDDRPDLKRHSRTPRVHATPT